MTAYRPAGRWSASAEQHDVGSANPPDRRTLGISRSQMPSKIESALKTGPNQCQPVRSGLTWFFARSLHSPWFSGRTPGGLRRTRPIQNANFLALEWLELSGDCPVTFRGMLIGLVSPTDFSGRQSGRNITKPAGKSTGKSDGVQRKVQWTAAESPTESPTEPNGQRADQLTYYYY